MSRLLEVTDLSLRIGQQTILQDVSFDLDSGTTLGLIGRSGAGKSLTALSIPHLLPVGSRASGSIRLAGTELLSLTEAARDQLRGEQIGVVFQEPLSALNPLMSIGAQLAESYRLFRGQNRTEAAANAKEALARVGLDTKKSHGARYPHELSGGQRQRAVIAIALARDPQLLIADEPTSALDSKTGAQILALLMQLCRESKVALLLVSHDLAAVATHCAEIAVLENGVLVEKAPPEQIFGQPLHAATKQLVRAATNSHRQSPATATVFESAPSIATVDAITVTFRKPGWTLGGRSREHTALENVSLSVNSGEIAGVIGESGSGKTTLARAILGLQEPDSGSIEIGGALFSGVSESARRKTRRKIQAVFQDPAASLNPRLRVGNIVAEPLGLATSSLSRAKRQQRVDECLQLVGLQPADAERFPHQFSGGQRQRIAIARALALRPELIVLDEATSALDPVLRQEILILLQQLARDENLAYLLITHDLFVVREFTDRVFVLHDGQLVEAGRTTKVLDSPEHEHTRALLESQPSLAEVIANRQPKNRPI